MKVIMGDREDGGMRNGERTTTLTVAGVNLGRLVLEKWRAGRKSDARLASLAHDYAGVYGQDAEAVYRAAASLTWDGEIGGS